MRIDLSCCRNEELKSICKWYFDGNCKLHLTEDKLAPCEKTMMLINYTIYTIEYYVKDKRFGWTNTIKEYVFGNSKEEALKKFDKQHPNVKVRSIVNQLTSNY